MNHSTRLITFALEFGTMSTREYFVDGEVRFLGHNGPVVEPLYREFVKRSKESLVALGWCSSEQICACDFPRSTHGVSCCFFFSGVSFIGFHGILDLGSSKINNYKVNR